MSLDSFANHVRGIHLGSEEFRKFLLSTENKASLQKYAESLGCTLTSEEQDRILALRTTIYTAARETKPQALPDAALEGIAGGSAAAWGALIGGGLACVGGILAVTVFSPIAVGLAAGTIIAGLATGTGGAAGAGIGAIVDALS
jgi:hypothetical protein